MQKKDITFTVPGVKMFGKTVKFTPGNYNIHDKINLNAQINAKFSELRQAFQIVGVAIHSRDKEGESSETKQEIYGIDIIAMEKRIPDIDAKALKYFSHLTKAWHATASGKTYKLKHWLYFTIIFGTPVILLLPNYIYSKATGTPGGFLGKASDGVLGATLAIQTLTLIYQSVMLASNHRLHKKILKSLEHMK